MTAGVERLDARRGAVPAAIGIKVALALAFVVALTVPLDQLEGKGMAFRFPVFMLSAVLVPLAWRRRFSPYPATADVLLVAPFLIDTLGNLVGLYDAYEATDDVMHTFNWVLLVAAFHAWRFRRSPHAGAMSRFDVWLLGVGIGALAIVGWEIAEWIVAETGAGGGLALTYDDTVGDLALSTAGGMIGSWLGVQYLPGGERGG
ncbi:MAG: hypothetical protein F4Z00_12675 [Acidimicrobiaceae bacterium]|nr:hypothetical protein [Acidimicrobiaceae bacterium]MXZ66381.1 hypothetical protein [Acidimicrobiaceae bacterium]MYF34327.1 hypothetical protein [Acidimicrobiaceae bacterium]MYG79419.1 hypothetical protein [Acidimicrobiaceae bacterium]MYJ83572.1 hypothetical protein [Acidimicrobiaceae bacterium]